MISSNKDVKKQMISLYDMLAGHEGYGELKVEFKILKKIVKKLLSIAENSTDM